MVYKEKQFKTLAGGSWIRECLQVLQSLHLAPSFSLTTQMKPTATLAHCQQITSLSLCPAISAIMCGTGQTKHATCTAITHLLPPEGHCCHPTRVSVSPVFGARREGAVHPTLFGKHYTMWEKIGINFLYDEN